MIFASAEYIVQTHPLWSDFILARTWAANVNEISWFSTLTKQCQGCVFIDMICLAFAVVNHSSLVVTVAEVVLEREHTDSFTCWTPCEKVNHSVKTSRPRRPLSVKWESQQPDQQTLQDFQTDSMGTLFALTFSLGDEVSNVSVQCFAYLSKVWRSVKEMLKQDKEVDDIFRSNSQILLKIKRQEETTTTTKDMGTQIPRKATTQKVILEEKSLLTWTPQSIKGLTTETSLLCFLCILSQVEVILEETFVMHFTCVIWVTDHFLKLLIWIVYWTTNNSAVNSLFPEAQKVNYLTRNAYHVWSQEDLFSSKVCQKFFKNSCANETTKEFSSSCLRSWKAEEEEEEEEMTTSDWRTTEETKCKHTLE